ncbi:uncharacterized protein si:ch211-174j14.2 [Carassius gibelio]|uniref:uncharacterized protein si:ch211-174j14.2 n=1 Tax=Carassius gibelio TaxID=101364 RepID=UPI0022774D45|nr:uncharacterized protein si:ch211-174j14.2 [Carassius gibelio]
MSSNWSDSEIKALLFIRADEEICRNLRGTVSDAVTYDKITNRLREQGIHRTKSQVISKLKTLRLKYMKINDHHKQSGNGRITWMYHELCQSIWGSSHSANPVALTGSLNFEGPQSGVAKDACDGSTSSQSVDTEAPTCNAELTDEVTGFTQPPRKKSKKNKDHMIDSIATVLQTMETTFREQEALRIQEQREYEERLHKEAKEEQKEERASMMAMWKEMMEFQGNLLKDIMTRPPPTTSLPLNPHYQQHNHHSQHFSFPSPSTSYMAPYRPPDQDAEASLHPQFKSSFLEDLQD